MEQIGNEALAHFNSKRFQEAVVLQEKLVQLMIEGLGHRHEETLQSKETWCDYLHSNGETLKALEQIKLVVEARESAFGPEHPETLDSMNFLGEYAT